MSVDTTSAKVAARALELGAHVVNDVSSLSEPELAEVVASYGAVLVLSHARGHQEAMAGFGVWPEDAYGDVVDDVLRDLIDHVCARAGPPAGKFAMSDGSIPSVTKRTDPAVASPARRLPASASAAEAARP